MAKRINKNVRSAQLHGKIATLRMDRRSIPATKRPYIGKGTIHKLVLPQKIQRPVIVTPRRNPKQTPVKSTLGKRGPLRISTALPECRIRKQYKKRMLKAIAAQIQRSGKGLHSWRRQRRRHTNILYRC